MMKKRDRELAEEIWTEAGGLITQSVTARIIGTTRQAVIKYMTKTSSI